MRGTASNWLAVGQPARRRKRARQIREAITVIGAVATVGALGLMAVTPPVSAAGALAVTIREPVEGASISRSAAPSVEVAGAVRFDTPVPTERTYYAGELCCDPSELSTTRTQGDAAARPESVTPVNELSEEPSRNNYATPGDEQVPFTLDATRPLEGVLTHVSYFDVNGAGLGAGLTAIDITVTAEEVGGAVRTLGTTTVNYVATPAQATYEVRWSVELPAELDKKDFTGHVTLTLVVRGYNALHGFTVPDDTNLTVPTYSTSFDRRVEIAVDDGPFVDGAVTLGEDGTTWTASIPTPEVGSHTIKARAIQGWRTTMTPEGPLLAPRASSTATRLITVTD